MVNQAGENINLVLLLLAATLTLGVLFGASGRAFAQGEASLPEPLLQENFDEIPDGGLPAGWKVVEGEWKVEGGRLIGKSRSSGIQGRILFGDPNWTDYEFSADVTFIAANEETRWTALIYRAPATGAYPYYIFTVRNNMTAYNGTEVARRATNGGWEVMATRPAPKRIPNGETFNLRVQVIGSSVRYFFNGEQIHEMIGIVQNPKGVVGLHVNGATVAFDNIVVRPLSPDQAPSLVQQAGIVPPARTTKTAAWANSAPFVVAHRGASKEAPENTLAAFLRGIELNADLLECDVYLSADGVPVILHDSTVNRTTNGSGSITSLTLEQIKQFDAGSWKGAQFAGERIPTLEELLELAKEKAQVLIEIKQAGQATMAATVAAIRKTGMTNNVVIQSFNPESVKQASQLAPDIPRALLMNDPGIRDAAVAGAFIVKQVLESGANAVSIQYSTVTPELVRYLHSRGIAVFVWTVDDRYNLQRMITAGVDAIITNDPATAWQVIASQ
ncbi:MAG: DUF1080 domain-containing protein [Limnochordaceae bacterium]|nr:DUF1080 domain-containing protein [Limnochordaceae bacterium]